jgi:hypothetical protein
VHVEYSGQRTELELNPGLETLRPWKYVCPATEEHAERRIRTSRIASDSRTVDVVLICVGERLSNSCGMWDSHDICWNLDVVVARWPTGRTARGTEGGVK